MISKNIKVNYWERNNILKIILKMRVKDINSTIKEWDLSEDKIWNLTRKHEIRGQLGNWKYENNELIGEYIPLHKTIHENNFTVQSYTQYVKENNIPEDTYVYIDVPNQNLQHLAHISYNKNNKRLNTAIIIKE